MNDHLDDDSAEEEKLNQLLNMEKLPFSKIQKTICSFIARELLSEFEINCLKLNKDSADVFVGLIGEANKFLNGELSLQELQERRVSAWKIFDKASEGSSEKSMARAVVMTLYDEKKAEYEAYGARMFLDPFFASLSELGPGYCRRFTQFVSTHAEEMGLPLN